MTATMFKAVLAESFLDSSKLNTYQGNQTEIKWRILGVQYDKLGLIAKGIKPAFIRYYQDKIKAAEQKIKKIIELDYALGNEIYNDETGIYFLVPQNFETNLITDQIDAVFDEEFEGETSAYLALSESSRSTMNITKLIADSKENFLKKKTSKKLLDQIKNNQETTASEIAKICPVCRIRLKQNDFCKTCEERKKGVLANWIENRNNQTIWLDELQDKNSRIALVNLKFELKDWLNGEMVNSLVVNDETEYYKKLDDLKKEIKANNNEEIKNILKKCANTELKIPEKTYKDFILRIVSYQYFNANIQTKLTNIINQSQISDADAFFLAEIMLQFILCQNPSPARLRRISESSKGFLQEAKTKTSRFTDLQNNPLKNTRLFWPNLGLKEGEYDYHGILFWQKDNMLYLISGLERAWPLLAQKKETKETITTKIKAKDTTWLKTETFKLTGCETKEQKKVTLSKANYETYRPYISLIEPTPTTWQVALPAECVPLFIQETQKLYYQHFRWAVGKLPLHIGVIIQNYKMPLYLGLQALRDIGRNIEKIDDIKISKTAVDFNNLYSRKVCIGHRKEECTQNTYQYYSLYALENSQEQGQYSFYINDKKMQLAAIFEKPDQTKFCFYPNTIDFEFLETNTRRNDIFYENASRKIAAKKNRPYTWEEWEVFWQFQAYFKDAGKMSKLQNLVSLILAKLADWQSHDKAIALFLVTACINIFKLQKEDRFYALFDVTDKQAFLKYQTQDQAQFKKCLYRFLDMFDFWHTSLKEEF